MGGGQTLGSLVGSSDKFCDEATLDSPFWVSRALVLFGVGFKADRSPEAWVLFQPCRRRLVGKKSGALLALRSGQGPQLSLEGVGLFESYAITKTSSRTASGTSKKLQPCNLQQRVRKWGLETQSHFSCISQSKRCPKPAAFVQSSVSLLWGARNTTATLRHCHQHLRKRRSTPSLSRRRQAEAGLQHGIGVKQNHDQYINACRINASEQPWIGAGAMKRESRVSCTRYKHCQESRNSVCASQPMLKAKF